jgi:hypothetical protein
MRGAAIIIVTLVGRISYIVGAGRGTVIVAPDVIQVKPVAYLVCGRPSLMKGILNISHCAESIIE